MRRYSSKISKYVTRAEAKEKSAGRAQYGSMVFDKTAKDLEKIFADKKDNKVVYDQVSKMIKDKGLSDIILPSFNQFARGESNADYKGVPLDIDSLYQMSFLKDKRINKLNEALGIKSSENKLNEMLQNITPKTRP